jgi:hypothetical protein
MRVYSRPPYPDMRYDYILVNAFSEETLRYVKRGVKSVIVDSGVHSVFHTLKLKEYPGGYQYWVSKVAQMWRYVSRLVPESYAVVPDYPSDYVGNEIEDNVERTLRNIEYATTKYPDVNWIIPLQGKRDDVSSVLKSLDYVRETGLVERYGYVAIAPTCTTRSVRFLADAARAVWRRVRALEGRGVSVKVHMFGVTTRAWEHIAHYVDSVDTIVTNYVCMELIGKMCTKRAEKEMAWYAFLERVRRVSVHMPVTIDDFLMRDA